MPLIFFFLVGGIRSRRFLWVETSGGRPPPDRSVPVVDGVESK